MHGHGRERDKFYYLFFFVNFFIFLEAGGSEVNPEHEQFVPRGGFVAELQVGGNVRVCMVCWGAYS